MDNDVLRWTVFFFFTTADGRTLRGAARDQALAPRSAGYNCERNGLNVVVVDGGRRWRENEAGPADCVRNEREEVDVRPLKNCRWLYAPRNFTHSPHSLSLSFPGSVSQACRTKYTARLLLLLFAVSARVL